MTVLHVEHFSFVREKAMINFQSLAHPDMSLEINEKGNKGKRILDTIQKFEYEYRLFYSF